MNYGKQYDRAIDLAEVHTREAGHHVGRFLALRSDAAKLKRGHRDRVLAANHFWRWREKARWAREHAQEAQAIKDAADQREAAQPSIFDARQEPIQEPSNTFQTTHQEPREWPSALNQLAMF